MGSEKRKLLTDFKGYLEQEIREVNDTPFSTEINEIINFFILKRIISQNIIRSYTIRKAYNFLTKQQGQVKKSASVKAIASKYGLHENTVWNTLKKDNSLQPKK